MSTVWLIKRHKKWSCSCTFLKEFVGVILAAVVDDHQTGFSLVIVTLHYRIPLVNGSLDIFSFVVGWNYDI